MDEVDWEIPKEDQINANDVYLKLDFHGHKAVIMARPVWVKNRD